MTRLSMRAASLALALGVLGTGAVLAGPKRTPADQRRLKDKHDAIDAKQAKELEKVVRFAVEKGLKTQAQELVDTIERTSPAWKGLADLKRLVDGCTQRAAAPKDAADFATKLKAARGPYAKELLGLAHDYAKLQVFTRAYDLVGDALVADPDQADARRLRGFEKVGKSGWVTKFEAQNLKDGKILYADENGVVQGWIPAKDKPQWEKGLRPFEKDWVTEAEETEKRQGYESNWWSVESEHFVVRTSVSRAEAYRFGQLLEDFYGQFFRNFLGFFDTEKGVELLFDTQPLKKKHVVIYFPDQKRYLAHVRTLHGDTELLKKSAGFYSNDYGCEPCSHFYKTEDTAEVLATTYHEITHQLFAETKEQGKTSVGNNWVPEGIASYVETWTRDAQGKWSPGANTKHYRLGIAKAHLAQHPEAKLSTYIAIDYKGFHKDDVRGLDYALGEALSHFLMHYEDGRYREDFVTFIAAFYAGTVTERSLYEALGVDEATLEKQFRAYVAQLPSGGDLQDMR
jgi:hypothetical protein